MKKALLPLLFLVCSVSLSAQVAGYTFTKSTGTYASITGGTLLISGTSAMDKWTSAALTIPSFYFGGTVYTTAYVTTNGLLTLGGTAPSNATNTGISTNTGSGIAICPFSADLDRVNSNANSEMRWQIIGNEIIFQWKQMKRKGLSESFDFQIRLNTANEAVSFIYQLNSGPASATTYQPEVGIRTSTSDYNNRLVSTGSETWAASLSGTANSSKCRFTSTSPAKSFSSGLTYTFAPSPQCSGTPAGGTAAASVTAGVCSASSVIVLSGHSTTFGVSYQWQSSTNGSSWTDIPAATNDTLIVSGITATTQYRCTSSCINSGLTAVSSAATVTITQSSPLATVTKTDAATCNDNGSLTVSDVSNIIVNANFSSLPPNSYLNGTAVLTNNYCQLTPVNSTYQKGSVVLDNSCGINTGNVKVEYDMLIGGGTFADGMAINFGPIASTSNFGETGDPAGLVISFDTHDNGSQAPGVYLYWQPTAGSEVPTPLTSFTSSGAFYRTNSWKHVVLTISAANKLSLTVGGTVVFTNYSLPAAYGTSDKSSWKWAFSGRIGALDDEHDVDNIVISAYGTYEYSINGTSWQSSNIFNVPAGTYSVYVRNTAIPANIATFGPYVITAPLPAAPGFIASPTVCGHSLPASLSVNPQAGCTVDWYDAASGGNLLQSGSASYNAAAAGTYYAVSRNTITGCLSSTRTAVILTVTPDVVPSLSISSAQTAFCESATATIIATAVNGGSSPVFTWSVNNTISGSYGATFSYVPADDDVVSCSLTSSETCTVSNTAVSNNISITLIHPDTTGLSSGDYVWVGTSNTLWANIENWLQYTGNNEFVLATAKPTLSDNVFIRKNGQCFATAPLVTMETEFCSDFKVCPGNSITFTGTGSLDVSGNWFNYGTFNAGAGTVNFVGTGVQEIQAGTSSFNNVVFNNSFDSTASIRISAPMIIKGNATFDNGIVFFTSTGSLEFADGASCNGGSASGFVHGTITKTGNDPFIFPTGTIGPGNEKIWAPLEITAPSDINDAFSCTYYFSPSPDHNNTSAICDPAQLVQTSGVEYWDLHRATGTSTPDVTLYWKDALRSGITEPSDLVVAHYGDCNGEIKWEAMSTTTDPLNGMTGSITGTGFTSYSPLTFGSKAGGNPLPVKLLSFSAECTGNQVTINWLTATESNNDYFTIERSADATNWETLKTVKGAGNSNQVITYSAVDEFPLDGTSYYRLKQTDFDGKFELFNPVASDCGNAYQPTVAYYPNPFSTEVLMSIDNLANGRGMIKIFDVLGNQVYMKTLTNNDLKGGKYVMWLSSLPSGMYFMEFSTGKFSRTTKMMKK